MKCLQNKRRRVATENEASPPALDVVASTPSSSSSAAPPSVEAPKKTDQTNHGNIWFKQLILRWSQNRMSSRDLCTQAYYSHMAGAAGASRIAVDPRLKGDNHHRKVQTVLGLQHLQSHLYYAFIPIWCPKRNCRVVRKVPMRLPHELIAASYEKNKALIRNVDPEDAYTRAFLDHDVTKAHGFKNVVPVGYYTDKVGLGKHNTFYRGSVNILYLRRRYMHSAVYVTLAHVSSLFWCSG